MKLFPSFPNTVLMLFLSTAAAFASVTVNSPQNDESVTSPFSLVAYATACSSQPISTIGYSIDNGDTTIFHGETSIDTQVSTSMGTHTLHVKSWGDRGALCMRDVTVQVTTVTNDPVANTSIVPSNAIGVSSIQTLGNWRGVHDSGTSGWANGAMSLVGSPTHSGAARQFSTSYSSTGGERYYVSFGDNATSTNFFYDGWVYVTDSVSHIANVELDLNQTMQNGQTVIMGVQCDGYSGTWDYTLNVGSPSNPKPHWAHSQAACNPRTWTKYTWHHIQASYSRSQYGKVTYKSVYFDGVQKPINVTVPSAYASGWGPTLLTNFQIDGLNGGSSVIYLDDLTIKRW